MHQMKTQCALAGKSEAISMLKMNHSFQSTVVIQFPTSVPLISCHHVMNMLCKIITMNSIFIIQWRRCVTLDEIQSTSAKNSLSNSHKPKNVVFLHELFIPDILQTNHWYVLKIYENLTNGISYWNVRCEEHLCYSCCAILKILEMTFSLLCVSVGFCMLAERNKSDFRIIHTKNRCIHTHTNTRVFRSSLQKVNKFHQTYETSEMWWRHELKCIDSKSWMNQWMSECLWIEWERKREWKGRKRWETSRKLAHKLHNTSSMCHVGYFITHWKWNYKFQVLVVILIYN